MFHTINVLALNVFISFHAILVLAFRSKSYLLVGMKHAYIFDIGMPWYDHIELVPTNAPSIGCPI
jgi:hypothetical protein